MSVSVCPFWVQIHGLPVEKLSRANAETIGSRLGKLMALETSSAGFCLSRGFLQVRVEINTSQPLPKGFWLRGKAGLTNDRWISFKFEKLPDFCYACGRLGHDNKGCRFVSKVDGENSGYGPEMRTSRARKGSIPIEVIRSEVDAAESRVQNLFLRRPEIQLTEKGARLVNASEEQVERPSHVFPQQTSKVVAAYISSLRTDTDVLHRTGVTESRVPGFIPSSHPHLNFPQASSPITPSFETGQTSDNGPHQTIIPILTNILSSPSPSPILVHNTSLPDRGPHYFVTEPPDSPRGVSTQPTTTILTTHPPSLSPINSTLLIKPASPFTNPEPPTSPRITASTQPNNTTNITHAHSSPSSPSAMTHFTKQISPNANSSQVPTLDPSFVIPVKPPSPKLPNIPLSTVFKSLFLKRKHDDEPTSPSRSKILRICSPSQPSAPPSPKPIQSSRKSRKGYSRTKSSPRSLVSPNIQCFLEDGLCEVPVRQLSVEGGECTSESMKEDKVDLKRMSAVNGRVAGPQQPPSLC
ncbi:hypothetical protein Vadar_021030 [Vaccinium darrowii]|uniref:Uncharacterized protein n=1 Tax=Vaccinium darrowii TaxID=229202 RepID=A0ACB7Z5A5_9ERIC|nr:hypothetical protein Vadar_021030 [Vaccinium darrowii]